jgi:hypothetical protein
MPIVCITGIRRSGIRDPSRPGRGDRARVEQIDTNETLPNTTVSTDATVFRE